MTAKGEIPGRNLVEQELLQAHQEGNPSEIESKALTLMALALSDLADLAMVAVSIARSELFEVADDERTNTTIHKEVDNEVDD